MQRRPAAAGLVAVSVLASLLIVLGLVTHDRQLAALKLDLRRTNVNLEAALGDAEREQVRAETSEREMADILYVTEMQLAARAWKGGNLRSVADLLKRQIPQTDQPDRRGLEWRFLWNVTQVKSLALDTLSTHVYDLRIASDGRRLAAVGKDAVLRLYDLPTGSLHKAIETGQREVNGAAFSPDGTRVATAGDDGSIRIWEISAAAEWCESPRRIGVWKRLHLAPTGRFLPPLVPIGWCDSGTATRVSRWPR